MAQSRFWCFTYIIRDPDEVALLDERIRLYTRGGVWQLEVGDENTPHIQGYVEFARTRRLAFVRSHVSDEAHWEMRKGTREECVEYCTKEDSAVAGPWYHGKLDIEQGTRTDINDAVELLQEKGITACIEAFPVVYVKFHRGLQALWTASLRNRTGTLEDKPIVYWLHGRTGTGKTRRAYAEDPSSVYFKDPMTKWWDGYTQQNVVVVDDYVGDNGTRAQRGMDLAYLLRLLDIYPMTVEVKGASVSFLSGRIYLTSNYTPAECFPTDRQLPALMRRLDYVIEMN